MKKIILSTTSLAFLSVATSAYAQSPLSITGEVNLWGSYTSLDGGSYSEDFKTDAELDFNLDLHGNGLHYGATVGTEIDDNNDLSVDEVYGYFSTGTLSFKAGKTEGAANVFTNVPRTSLGLLASENYEDVLGNVPMNSFDEINNSGKSEKIVGSYSIEDLSVSVSYAPEFVFGSGVYENAIEASANYGLNIDNFYVGVNGSIGTAKGVGLQDYTTFKVGANTSISGVDLGVDYIDGEKFGLAPEATAADNKTFTIGAGLNLTEQTYIAGNYAVAVGDKLSGTSGNFSDSMNAFGVGVTHSVTQNWSIGSDVFYVTDEASDSIGGTKSKTDNVSFVVGTRLNF